MKISQALKVLEAEGITSFSYPPKYLEANIGNRSYRDMVAGIGEGVLVIVTRNLLWQYTIHKFKLEVEHTSSTSYPDGLLGFVFGRRTVTIQFKKDRVNLADPVEGEMQSLIQNIDLDANIGSIAKVRTGSTALFLKKGMRYGKYVLGGIAVLIVGDVVSNLAMEWAHEEMKEVVSESFEEEGEHIAEKAADKFLDKLRFWA